MLAEKTVTGICLKGLDKPNWKQRLGLTMQFITHDLRTAAQICDRIAVMQRGVIVEHGPTAEIFGTPLHAYTSLLLDSIPGRHCKPPV